MILSNIVPVVLINLAFIVQAILLKWELGTMVWIYWLQGLMIALLGLLATKQRLGWYILIGLLAFYGIFMFGLTFPSDSMDYVINDRYVTPEEFTVFATTQWSIVAANVWLLVAGYLYALLFRKDKSAYSGGQVVKRLLPLHLTIILAATTQGAVIVFLVLKAILDVVAEYIISRPLQLKANRRKA